MKDAPAATPFEIVPPDDTPEFMYPAYFSCLYWAATKDEFLKQFYEDTGTALPPPRSGIEALVDQASGFNPHQEYLRAFVPWFNTNVWGDINGIENPEKEG